MIICNRDNSPWHLNDYQTAIECIVVCELANMKKYQLCSNTALQTFEKLFACIDWSCCKYSTPNSLPVAPIVDSGCWCFAITCLACLFFKYVTVRDYKGSPTGMHWLCVVSSTLHPAWAVLANVHAGVTCIRNIFEDLVNRLTRSGLRQWVAGVFVRAGESREVEAWTRHDKGKLLNTVSSPS